MPSAFFRNYILKTAFTLSLIVFFACGDDDSGTDPKTSAEDCITKSSSIHGTVIPGEYIVSFENETGADNGRSAHTAARVLAKHRILPDHILDEIHGKNLHYVVRLSSEEAERLKQDSLVHRVEPDRVLSMCSCFTVIEPRSVTWNADRVGYGDGTGKTAWVLDTGIDFKHPDLTVDESRSRSFVDGVSSAADDNGHGTHVAGIIGAKNNEIGTLGIASGATLVSLKILDEKGDGRLSGALKALSFVRSNGKSGDVVNISMGLDEISEILEDEIRGVGQKGIFIAIAAGNESQSISGVSPARTSGANIYTVSAVDSLDQFAGFSNFGKEVDFAAPGVRILSTYRNGKYAYMSGTSMAAPHVAGLLLINNGEVNSDGIAIDDPDGIADRLAHQ